MKKYLLCFSLVLTACYTPMPTTDVDSLLYQRHHKGFKGWHVGEYEKERRNRIDRSEQSDVYAYQVKQHHHLLQTHLMQQKQAEQAAAIRKNVIKQQQRLLPNAQ